MALKLKTAPVAEPVSLTEAKLHCRVDHSTEDTLISDLITAARIYCEHQQNRALVTQTWYLYLDRFPDKDYIEIPLPPLQSVTSVLYYDTDDTENTLSTDDYDVDINSFVGRVHLKYGETWPSLVLRPSSAIKIEFVTGYPNYVGTVDTVGTAVTWATGDKFSTDWIKGKTIDINSVTYRVSSVTDTENLVLTATAGDQTGASYEASDLPLNVKQAMLLLIAHWYGNRESVLVGTVSKHLEMAVDALLGFERVW